MLKLQPAVKRNIFYVALVDLLLSLLLQLMFILLSAWDISVVLGNLLGYCASVLNFFLLCLTVQSAVIKDPDDAKTLIKTSQRLRFLMMLAIAIIANFIPCFNLYAVIIPFTFNGIAVVLRTYIFKDKES